MDSNSLLLRQIVAFGMVAVLLPSACGGSDDADDPGGGGPRLSCTSHKDCRADDLLCDTATRVCVQCLQTEDCDDGELCVANECRSVSACESTRDCALDQVCSPSLKLCVDCETVADCNTGEVCTSHVCQASCESDKDCRELGLLCNAAFGYCVDCAQHADCEPDQYCTEIGSCAADRCVAGSAECEDDQLIVCNAEGSAFQTEPCNNCAIEGGEPSCGGTSVAPPSGGGGGGGGEPDAASGGTNGGSTGGRPPVAGSSGSPGEGGTVGTGGASGGGASGGGASGGGGTNNGAGGSNETGGSPGNPAACAEQTMILVQASGTMFQTPTLADTWYDAVSAALTGADGPFAERDDLGLMVYYASGIGESCLQTSSVAVESANVDTVAEALGAASDSVAGFTNKEAPVPEALEAAAAALGGSRKDIVLIWPASSPPDTCETVNTPCSLDPLLVTVQSLWADGVRVVPLALGLEATAESIRQLANAGSGQPIELGPNYCSLPQDADYSGPWGDAPIYNPMTTAELPAALADILASLADCEN